jgi:hypothetical protein
LSAGLSGWGACTLAAAASRRQSGEHKRICANNGAILRQKRFPVIWQGQTQRGEGEDNMATENNSLPLKHYTSIENLFKILDTSRLLLSKPKNWEDKNDYAALRAFCRLKGTKARVLCFLDGEESIHHWNTFSKNGYGCSISFARDEILKQTKGDNFLHNSVKYKHVITDEELRKMDNKDIPFLKRNQYECEKEYRIIWFGTGKAPKVPFKRETAIRRIILSPRIPDTNRKKIKDYLKIKYGLEAEFSRVFESEQWIDRFDNLGKKR